MKDNVRAMVSYSTHFPKVSLEWNHLNRVVIRFNTVLIRVLYGIVSIVSIHSASMLVRESVVIFVDALAVRFLMVLYQEVREL